MLFEGSPPPTTSCSRRSSAGLGLVPRYRQRLAFVPLGPGPPALGRRPPPEPPLPRARHRAARPRLGAAAEGARRARVRPAARPRQAALGDLARRGARGRPLRDALEDPPRARGRHLRAWTSCRCCSTPRRSRPRPPTRASAGCRARSPPPRSCSARRSSSARRSPASSRARCAPSSAARGAWPRGCATPPSASARWPGPASTPRPPPPTTSRSARTGASPGCAPTSPTSRRSRTSSAAPSTTSCSSTIAGALGKHLRRRGQNTDGVELKAMVPVSVRADVERGALGNRVAAMMAPLPGLVPGPRRAARHRARGAEGAEVGRPGGRRPGAHRPVRLRAADRHGPGRRA